MAKNFSYIHQKKIICNLALDNWKNRGGESYKNRDDWVEFYLKNTNESKTEKFVQKLDLIIGCKYVLTKNYCSEIGLSNNTEIILEKIILDGIYKPCCLLVSKVRPNNKDKSKLFENLDLPWFPIFEDTCYFPLSLPQFGKSINIRRKQFPLAHCFAVTVNNQQGATINTGVIDFTIPIDKKWNQPTAYVALTRFRRLENLIIVDDFDIDILRKKPHSDLLKEELRYKYLANQTLRNYYSTEIEYTQVSKHLSLEQYILLIHKQFH